MEKAPPELEYMRWYNYSTRTASSFRLRRGRAVCLGIFAILLTVLLASSWSPVRESAGQILAVTSQSSVYNRTLGFEKIFVIGLPDRTDRRDFMTLAASLTEIDFDFEDGIKTAEVSVKATPDGWSVPNDLGILGSRQSHLKLLNRIVKEGIQTALILEDDADGNYGIKQQLHTFANIVADLQGSSSSSSPYGNKWDVLWPGNGRTAAGGPGAWPISRMGIVSNDPSVPPTGLRYGIWLNERIPPEIYQNDTRLVFEAWKGYNTFAYAVTYQSARKILSSVSLEQDTRYYDFALNALCKNKPENPFKCYSIYPTLFSSHRAAGSAIKDSDNFNLNSTTHVEHTYDTVYSVRQNVQRLLNGQHLIESQWPKYTRPEWDIRDPYPLEYEIRDYNWTTVKKSKVKGINADWCEKNGKPFHCWHPPPA